MSKKEILIKGAIGNSNFGDDLLTFSICHYLENINIPINKTIISNEKYLDRHIKGVSIKNFYDINGAFDVMIYAGGTQFASFHKKNNQFNNWIKRFLTISKYLDRPLRKIKIKFLGLATFKYKSLAIIGIGVGPFFSKDKYYKSVIRTLQGSEILSVRDVLGEKICKENSLQYTRGSDLIFSLPESFWTQYRVVSTEIKKVGVIIRDWHYSEEKASFFKKVHKLESENYEIVFFSFCENKDIQSLNYLKKNGYRNSIIIWNPKTDSFSSYLQELSRCDIFLTSRYHGALVASLLRKPFISIGIEPKLTMVANLFGMPCWEFPYDIQECHFLIRDVDENLSNYVNKLGVQTKIEAKKNKIMMDELKELLY